MTCANEIVIMLIGNKSLNINVSRETLERILLMDISTFLSLLGDVGFPVACFLMCAWYVKYREDINDQKITNITTMYNEENKRMVEALNNNTLALTKLSDALGKES